MQPRPPEPSPYQVGPAGQRGHYQSPPEKPGPYVPDRAIVAPMKKRGKPRLILGISVILVIILAVVVGLAAL